MLAVLLIIPAGVASTSIPVSAGSGDNYPEPWRSAPLGAYNDTWGYSTRYCPSWVAWALHDRNKFEMPRAIGHAANWGIWASGKYPVNRTPAAGAVAWWRASTAYPYGHVAWVRAVSGSTVTIEEYNYGGSPTWHVRTIAASRAEYIHFKDLSTYQAAFHSQSVPATVAQGDTGTVNFRFKNTGTVTWRRDQGVRLGTINPDTYALDYLSPFYNPATWIARHRAAALAEASVSPGQVGTFNVRLYVPPTMAPGTYRFRVRPLDEGAAWMEPKTLNVYLPITVVARRGWHAEYYSDTSLTWSCANRYEDTSYVFKSWGSAAPMNGCPTDRFSVRFTKLVNFPGGRYTFHVDHDDGARLYVDDRRIIDAWSNCSFCASEASIDLTAGNHVVRVEYYENLVSADLAAWWSGPGALPAKETRDPNQWYGEYWGTGTSGA